MLFYDSFVLNFFISKKFRENCCRTIQPTLIWAKLSILVRQKMIGVKNQILKMIFFCKRIQIKSDYNVMKRQIPSPLFSNPLIFHHICEYLAIKDVLRLSQLSKEMKEIIQRTCTLILKQTNINLISHKSAINRMQFYFNRCLKIVKDDKQPKNNKTIVNPFKLQAIKFFQVGSLYSCYLTKNGLARIFRTSTFIDENINQKLNYFETRNGIQDIKSKSEKVILTKNNGEVTLLSTSKYSNDIIQHEELIHWSLSIPIKKVQSSFSYAIFFPEEKTSFSTLSKQLFPDSKPFRKEEDDDSQTHLIVRNMLSNEHYILCVPCSQIVECTVGHKTAFFISEQYQCFYFDFQLNLEEERYLQAKVFPGLAGKTIVKISNGYNFFVALQRNMESFENWNNEKVINWLRQIGLKDYIKIARAQNLDGKKLINIEKTYMINVLGITKPNMQNKLLTSIEEQLKKKSNQDQLYGWGKNQYGQLGSASANYIAKPQKIKMNCLPEGQYIDGLFCGWYQSFIRTQKGRIFCTVTKNERAKKKQREEKIEQGHSSDSEEKLPKNKKKKKNTKNARDKQQKKVKKQNKFSQEEYWYLSPMGKSFFVQAFKDNTFYIQCPNQHKEQPDKKKKLRTAKTILNKILWSSLNREEFKVGYVDNELGLIETVASQFEMFDVKEGRIKYFKRKGIIIWDRQNKIDYL